MNEEEELSSYDEGYEDYYSGFEPSDCPYVFDTEDYFQWLDGWYLGCVESEGPIWQLA